MSLEPVIGPGLYYDSQFLLLELYQLFGLGQFWLISTPHICTDFPIWIISEGVSSLLYSWSYRTILIPHDHSFFFYPATWQRLPPQTTLQAKSWQMKNAKGKEMLSPYSSIFHLLSISKLEGSQLPLSQKISTGNGAGRWESPGGLYSMKSVYMSSSPYGLKNRKLQDLWEIICGPRIRLRTLLCHGFCL